jgi:hypothetical protein
VLSINARSARVCLSDVQRKLADLHKLEHELRLALRSCNRELRKRSVHCPILRARNPRKPESETKEWLVSLDFVVRRRSESMDEMSPESRRKRGPLG